MARTKKPAKKRMPWEPPEDAHLWGGHLYDPPSKCKRRDKMFRDKHDGNWWIDVNICTTVCPQQCDHFKAYRKTWRKR